MRRTLFLLGVFVLMGAGLCAQDREQEEKDIDRMEDRPGGFDRSKLFAGGNFGLGFGSSFSFVNISPQLGYRFTDYVAAGAGVNFIYNSFKDGFGNKENFGYAGLNVFGRLYPIKYIVLHAQPELNYSWGKFKYSDGSSIKAPGAVIPTLLVGGGANIPNGGNSFFTIMMMYDVVQDVRSPYGTAPFLNFGVNFGL